MQGELAFAVQDQALSQVHGRRAMLAIRAVEDEAVAAWLHAGGGIGGLATNGTNGAMIPTIVVYALW